MAKKETKKDLNSKDYRCEVVYVCKCSKCKKEFNPQLAIFEDFLTMWFSTTKLKK